MRTEIMNTPVDVLSSKETLALIQSSMLTKQPLHHVAMNVAKLLNMRDNRDLRDDVASADIIGIDGMGIVLALRLKGIDVPERVAGIDLMNDVLSLCAKNGFKPYFLGAEKHIVELAAEKAITRNPNLVIAGVQDGYFSKADEARVVDDIRQSGADCLFVAMPTPRKERFLAAHRHELNVPFIMGVGGSFDVLAGKVSRAPEILQRFGCEWLYRLYQEPGRMWRRYLRTNTIFAALLLHELFSGLRAPYRTAPRT